MSLSKKIRFEVFKRDGFRCAYCGKTPPTVTLEVDHIEPVSKGGNDSLNNLLTACFDCNRGKSNVQLETIPQALGDNLDVLKEKRLQMREYKKWVEKIDDDYEILIDRVEAIFQKAHLNFSFSPLNRDHVRGFIEQIGIEETEKSMRTSANKFYNDPVGAWRYFCGICWRRVHGQGSPWEEKKRNGR